MKRLVSITGTILIICLFVGVFFAPSGEAHSTSAVQSEPVSTVNEEIYIIKAEDNHIVVYKKGESEPYLNTDTLIDSLPKGDTVYLEKGIEVEGRNNLRKALEDYCS